MADKYLKEDASGGYQLEDGSGVLLLEASETPSGGWMTRSAPAVLRAAVAGAVVFALGMPQVADAAACASASHLSPRPTIQNPPGAGAMASGFGLGWLARQPDPVRVAVPSRSVVVTPLSPPAAPSVDWWYPRPQEPVQRLWTAPSVYAQPSIGTAAATQDVTWWPQFPDRIVQRIRYQEPLTVGPPVSPTLPSEADAVGSLSGGHLVPRPTIHNAPVAGPVLIPTAAAAPDLPLQFSEDGLIRPDRWTHHLAIAGPVAIPLEAGWWPRIADRVVAPIRPVLSVIVTPILPLDGAALSTLPWLMRGAPLVLPQVPTRHVLALNPTTPAPVQVTPPWHVPSGQLVFRPVHRYESVYAKPPRPTDPDGRSNLPWLPQAPVGVRPPVGAPSSMAIPPSGSFLLAPSAIVLIAGTHDRSLDAPEHDRDVIGPMHNRDLDAPTHDRTLIGPTHRRTLDT